MTRTMCSTVAVMCLTGFVGLSYAGDMGKPQEGMKNETMKKDEMTGGMQSQMNDMKAKQDGMKSHMKGDMKHDGMKQDEMKGDRKGKTGEMGK
ncbi:MAG TPA: hypothetical protein VJ746_17505 [Nitrospira sp.]|nr:hypothetical protein [Nitrospira sp.]